MSTQLEQDQDKTRQRWSNLLYKKSNRIQELLGDLINAGHMFKGRSITDGINGVLRELEEIHETYVSEVAGK